MPVRLWRSKPEPYVRALPMTKTPSRTPSRLKPAGYTHIKRNAYSLDAGFDPRQVDDFDELRCTCDANGVPGGYALTSSGTGCDPAKCIAAMSMVECSKYICLLPAPPHGLNAGTASVAITAGIEDFSGGST